MLSLGSLIILAASVATPVSRFCVQGPELGTFNPHQRCRYSDLPFARIHFFYTARSRNDLEGWTRVSQTTKIAITRQICIQKMHSTRGIRYQGGAKPPGRVSSPKTARNRTFLLMRVLARQGNFTLVGLLVRLPQQPT